MAVLVIAVACGLLQLRQFSTIAKAPFHTYIIHHPPLVERKAAMLEQLKVHGLSAVEWVEQWSVDDLKALNRSELSKFYDPDRHFENGLPGHQCRYEHGIRLTDVSNSIKFHIAIESFINRGDETEFALLLEDDQFLGENFQHKVGDILKSVPVKYAGPQMKEPMMFYMGAQHNFPDGGPYNETFHATDGFHKSNRRIGPSLRLKTWTGKISFGMVCACFICSCLIVSLIHRVNEASGVAGRRCCLTKQQRSWCCHKYYLLHSGLT
jgi:hypothetical protein